MKSLADALPSEMAQQIHPDWRENEADYWSLRGNLLSQFRNRWIAFADGTVVAAAARPLDVFLAVQDSVRHPFVIRVGDEDEPWYHIRQQCAVEDIKRREKEREEKTGCKFVSYPPRRVEPPAAPQAPAPPLASDAILPEGSPATTH